MSTLHEPLHLETPRSPLIAFLAETDPVTRRIVASVLRGAGYSVYLATDGAYLVQLLAEAFRDLVRPPDLVVMDTKTPLRDGEWLLRAIRRGGWSTPVVMLASEDEPPTPPGSVLRALDAVVLKKPVGESDLRTILAGLECERRHRASAQRGATQRSS